MEQYVYSEGDPDWYGTFIQRVEKTSKGMNGIVLTNFTASAVCTIASGSVVEVNGALFIASSNTTVTGVISTGLNYILLSVTDTTASPYWASTMASTYDTSKLGLYHDNDRYVGECYYGAIGIDYTCKTIYPERTRELTRKLPTGEWIMTSVAAISVSHDLIMANIMGVDAVILNDGDTARYPIAFTGEVAGDIDVDLKCGATVIAIERLTGGIFDTAAFNAGSFIRAYITIRYEI